MEDLNTTLTNIARLMRGLTNGKTESCEPGALDAVGGALVPASSSFRELAQFMNAVRESEVSDSERALADATITGLERMLEKLRPLSERLAEIDAERVAAQDEVKGLRAAFDAREEEVRELRSLEKSLRRRLREKKLVLGRERKRHTKTREKVVERQKVATERWTELRSERARANRLERELARERSRWDALRAPLCELVEKAEGDHGLERTPLAELMRIVVKEQAPRQPDPV